MSKNQKNGIQVIARAASILRLLKDNQSGLSLGQISKQVLLPRSTVQRIVNSLQTERLVISTAAGRGLRLGPEISALAQATNYNVVEACRLFLTELTEVTGETADLSVLRGAGVIFLDQVPGTQRLRTVSSVGEVFPLTTTANGMACLSRLSPKSAHLLVADEWDRRSIVSDIQKMEQKLSDIRQNRLAYDEDAHTMGISAIGFAFNDLSGDVVAISIPVPSTRFLEKRDLIEKALLKTAFHIDKVMEK
jgi:DNA-binding IclR family transcriptional regulator|tara:strand:- start:4405 stop:5151 length:747 start_codon:yes stop_codon:yes gene_type:complete